MGHAPLEVHISCFRSLSLELPEHNWKMTFFNDMDMLEEVNIRSARRHWCEFGHDVWQPVGLETILLYLLCSTRFTARWISENILTSQPTNSYQLLSSWNNQLSIHLKIHRENNHGTKYNVAHLADSSCWLTEHLWDQPLWQATLGF